MHYLRLFTHNLAPAAQKVCVGLNHAFHPVQVDLCWEVQPLEGILVLCHSSLGCAASTIIFQALIGD